METLEVGPFEFHDKIPLKKDLARAGVRVVPPGVVRYGAFFEPGVIVMPGYVNIGARVGAGTMVDTWATVGSCAQIGKDVPPRRRRRHRRRARAAGRAARHHRGRRLRRLARRHRRGRARRQEAVIGAGVVLTSSTAILDVSGPEVVEHRGRVPARSVVIPGTRTKKFPAGEFGVPCALIIGKRSESTDRKVSLNDALRDFAVPV